MLKGFKTKNKYENIFAFCVLLSFLIHLAAIFCLNRHFLSLSSVKKPFSPSEKISSPTALKISEKDVLNFAIDKSGQKGKVETKIKTQQRVLKVEDGVKEEPPVISIAKEEKISSHFVYKPSDTSFKKEMITDKPKKTDFSYQMQKIDNTKKIVQSLKNSIMEIKQKEPKAIFTKAKLTVQKEISSRDFFSLEPAPNLTLSKLPKKDLVEDASKLKVSLLKQWKLDPDLNDAALKAPFLPYLPHIPTLSELNTIKCSDDFDVDFEYIAKDDGPGYVFAITLIPKPISYFKKLKQNFYFVLDRSNSIQNKRFTMTRSALASALLSLNKDDTFNILTFDSKLDLVFGKNQHPTHEMILEAKHFLKNQNIGNFFSSKVFFLPLNKMLNNPIKQDEINNIIFITDGDELDKPKNYRLLQKWTEINNGLQSFYALGLSTDKNLPILDFFTSTNKGQLLIATSTKNIRRHLVNLIKSLSTPVAKNIVVTAYDQSLSNIVFYQDPSKQNPLYLDSPYVLIGSIDKLEDFCLFIQGKNPERWFNIKKYISFQRAKRGGESLQKKWVVYKANKLYEDYLKNNDLNLLKKAQDLLKPYDVTPAFK